MKTLVVLLFSALISGSYGGVGIVTPEIEAEALRLWEKFCGGAEDQGTEDNLFIYCKRAPKTEPIALEHSTELPQKALNDVVVFVKPPSYHYEHNVTITGKAGDAQKTIIYVKPSNNSHNVNIIDSRPPPVEAKKPTVYFLKGIHGNDAKSAAAPRDDSSTATTDDSMSATVMPVASETVEPPSTEVYAAPSFTNLAFSAPSNKQPQYYWNGFEANRRFRYA